MPNIGQWKCIFCQADNKTTHYSVIEDRSAHIELTDPVYEFEELNETNTDNNTMNTRPLVVVIDQHIDAQGLKVDDPLLLDRDLTLH